METQLTCLLLLLLLLPAGVRLHKGFPNKSFLLFIAMVVVVVIVQTFTFRFFLLLFGKRTLTFCFRVGSVDGWQPLQPGCDIHVYALDMTNANKLPFYPEDSWKKCQFYESFTKAWKEIEFKEKKL